MTLNLSELATVWEQLQALAPAAFLPITDDASYQQVLETLEALMTEIGDSEHHRLEGLAAALTERLQVYEDAAFPMPVVLPARMLAYLMELRGILQKALEEATGLDQGNLSKLLNGRRDFNVEHIRVLSRYFKVDPSVFLN